MIVRIIRLLFAACAYLLAPPSCAYCRRWLQEQTILCATCMLRIRPVVSVRLPITKSYAVTVHSLSLYIEPLKTLIKAKHYRDRVASCELARLMCMQPAIATLTCDYIIPVPLHWTRYAWRGFNQAEEMARVIGRCKKVPMIRALRRIKRTAFQAHLDKDARKANLEDAFALDIKHPELLAGKHVVLVDDLLTTGATIRAAARCLRILKPASITVLVAARVG